jgi:hypothetical protein
MPAFVGILTRIYRYLQKLKRRFWDPWTRRPPIDGVDFGDLRRTRPISTKFGFDRGLPIDRYYIERFLQKYSSDIRGRVLEIGDPYYTRKFGGEQVTFSDVLHVNLWKPGITIVGDLAQADHIPSDSYDCFIFTQTLQYIFDLNAAIKTSSRILKPRGVLLATFPGISKIAHPSITENWDDYWRLTSRSARRSFVEIFTPNSVTVGAYGNVLSVITFLQGIAAEELQPEELNHQDPDFELLITVRAVKM